MNTSIERGHTITLGAASAAQRPAGQQGEPQPPSEYKLGCGGCVNNHQSSHRSPSDMSHIQRIGHYRLGKNLGIGSFGKVRCTLLSA
eukprot:4170172-Pleurochrysis_carterae.AAC.4